MRAIPNSQTAWKKKKKSQDSYFPNVKTYYKATENKTRFRIDI